VIDRTSGMSPLTLARVAGLLYLVIFLMAPFAEFFVREGLIVAGDASTTASNIIASEGLFRAGFATDLIVFVIEIAQAALLYILLAPVSRPLALVMSFARLAQATILGLNLLNMFTGLQLLTGSEYAAAFDAGQVQALALVFLNAQSAGYELGLVFFALHLFTLGYLVYQSGYLPRILGVLLVVSAIGYVANSFAVFLAPDLADVTAVAVLIAALIGELPLTLWLLVKGVNARRFEERSTAPATRPVTAGAA
jgi:hypothetical protein